MDLFCWLKLGSWDSLLGGALQSLAIVLLIVIVLSSLVSCILLSILNTCWQPLACQVLSIRIRQLREINNNYINDEDYKFLQPGHSSNGNREYVTLRLT